MSDLSLRWEAAGGWEGVVLVMDVLEAPKLKVTVGRSSDRIRSHVVT